MHSRLAVFVAIGLNSAIVSMVSAPAEATPVQWFLENTSLSNGASLTGSFYYDATTTAYSNIDIVMSATTAFPSGITFTHIGNAGYDSASSFQAITAGATIGTSSAIGNPYLFLSFSSAMTNAGGILTIAASYDGIATCGDAYCSSNSASVGSVVNNGTDLGEISTPEPLSMALFGTGIAGLAIARRRRK
jgi:hypothetical protein